jgi:hypothetical protein
MDKYYKFTTESEANSACPLIRQTYIDAKCPDGVCTCPLVEGVKECHCNCHDWAIGTVCWDLPKQRTTNTDWVITYCDTIGDSVYDVIEIDKATEWPEEEI